MTLNHPTATSQSFEKSAIPLFLGLKPSRTCLVLLVTTHAAAALAIFLAALPLAVQLAAASLICVSLYYNYRQESQPQQLIWRAGNRWVIETTPASASDAQGSVLADALIPRSTQAPNSAATTCSAELASIDFFSRWLVILTLRTEFQRNKKFVVLFDSLSENTFRLLRVRLRIEGFTLLNPEQEH